MQRTRLLSLVLIAAFAAALLVSAQSAYAGEPGEPAPAQTTASDIDDHDDTRVEVQLAVLGVALFVVVGVGTGAYLLRRRLGLVAPPPEQSGAAHH